MLFLPLKFKNRSADYKVDLCAAEMYYALCDRVGLDEWNNLKRKYPEAQYFESLMGEIAFDDVYNLYMNREDCKRFAEATSSLAREIVEWFATAERWVGGGEWVVGQKCPPMLPAMTKLQAVFELKEEMEQKYSLMRRFWLRFKDFFEFPLRQFDARVQKSREK